MKKKKKERKQLEKSLILRMIAFSARGMRLIAFSTRGMSLASMAGIVAVFKCKSTGMGLWEHLGNAATKSFENILKFPQTNAIERKLGHY